MVRKTPLYEKHIELNATMVDFGGFLMPMRYKKTSIVEEHITVRNDVGMFDTSHMGRIWVTGNDALEFLNIMVPRDIDKLSDFQAGYTFMLNENGGFRDDVIITRFSSTELLLVCNAGNLDKIWNWINAFAFVFRSAGKNIELDNRSYSSSMIAIQGPKAISLIEKLACINLPSNRFRVKWIEINGEKILFSSTGYTGASGGELMIFAIDSNIAIKAIKLWELLLNNNVMPCALGSRDTLRMEAGYRLYGNDIDENIHLLESGLDFIPFANIEKETGYVGQHNILNKIGKTERVFVSFKLLSKGIPRHGHKILIEGKEVGMVLSGTKSPLTKDSFGMALVLIEYKNIGSKFDIDIRGKLKQAEVIELPLYDESIYGVTINK